ncbi:hypothetical protein JOD43_002093 [Pullulanibacillus pueri]|uniref:YolD-like family protein n=1 Tax=Pullulanibacillus pueri TaxID=1437324 RepID=A0A8J3EM26_9BACL|nr:hypothetical protein [Pullulanibacillus pueri]MBM7681921.1 hypothetical protein [Pullulanibacillus pueri]GGH83452.1 hypothetical protein GCM10007096_24340 [Pullulanibacillus pueri]
MRHLHVIRCQEHRSIYDKLSEDTSVYLFYAIEMRIIITVLYYDHNDKRKKQITGYAENINGYTDWIKIKNDASSIIVFISDIIDVELNEE